MQSTHNSAERAYQKPCVTAASTCRRPAGASESRAISARPMFRHQNAFASSFSSQYAVRLSPRVMVFQTLAQVAADIDRAQAARPTEMPRAQSAGAPPRANLLRRVLQVFRSQG